MADSSTETVYIAQRKIPIGNKEYIMPGKPVPGVEEWPTFAALLSQNWIAPENDPRTRAHQTRLDRAMKRSRAISEQIKEQNAKLAKEAKTGKVSHGDNPEEGEETEETKTATDVDPSELTVGQLSEVASELAEAGDVEAIQSLLEKELEGKGRSTAVTFLEQMVEDLTTEETEEEEG